MLEGTPTLAYSLSWEGVADGEHRFRDGERVLYVLAARDAHGNWDVTEPRAFTLTEALVDPAEPADLAARAAQRSDARTRTIAVRGSAVRMTGKLPPGTPLSLGGAPVTADADGRFGLEQILPPGMHDQLVRIGDGSAAVDVPVTVEVRGEDSFVVGIADLTVGQNDLSGPGSSQVRDPRFDGDVFAQGRLAFYLRERLGNRGQLVAHLDTQEEELGDVFRNLDHRDPRRLFRRLDPDLGHLNYGDGSVTTPDVDTQGRFYGRLDWERSRAMWGNFATGLTGTEFAEFNRSLYGGLLDYRSTQSVEANESRVRAGGFASQAQSAFAHDEFLGTGGSLYYLRHQDVVQGSEKVWVEIRERDTDRVARRATLQRGRDYEFDDIQGRLILSRPLLQVADQVAPSIIQDTPLDGNRARLVVDYEYLPTGIGDGDWLYGARAKAWVNDRIAVGGTVVDEARPGQNYALRGGDVTLRGGAGTYLRGEYAESEATQASTSLFSDDGGITFAPIDPDSGVASRAGEATLVEGRLDLADFGSTDLEISGWWKDREGGFSTARAGVAIGTTDYGAEVAWRGGPVTASGRWAERALEGSGTNGRLSGQVDWSPVPRIQLGGELRRLSSRPETGLDRDDLLAGLRVGAEAAPGVQVYAAAQTNLDSGDQRLGTLGARARVARALAVRAEGSVGDAGSAVRAGADVNASEAHTLYGTYTLSTDRNDEENGAFTLGQRKSLTDQLSVFTENRFVHGDRRSGIGQLYGLSFRADERWMLSSTYEQSDLDDESAGAVDRRAVAASASYRGTRLSWRGSGELRDDEGPVDRRQWVTTQRADLRLSEAVTALGKVNYSITERDDAPDDARFAETGLALAYRPVEHDRLQILAKHTFLHDLSSPGQSPGGTDQRSHVFLGEALYDVLRGLELGARGGHRRGQLRERRDDGDWHDSRESLAAARVRYHLGFRWDALGEYRWRWVAQAEDRHQGALLGIYRHLGEHLKLGVGFNFSDFSDDLTDLDYDHQGWFVKAIGKL